VLQAIRKSRYGIETFKDWAVVGAPKYPGRILAVASMAKFFDQGVRGISPHVIPQNSLHSLSGVVSVALGMGGPNVGAGGGRTALAEGLTTAFSLLADGRLPGVWLIATEWDREPVPQKNGRAVADGLCHAVALMLTAVEDAGDGLCLSFQAPGKAAPGAIPAKDNVPSAVALAAALAPHPAAPKGAVLWRLSLDWGAEVMLVKNNVGHSLRE
jgi:hypothetical protein